MVLMVVGVKMLLAEWLKLPSGKHFNLYLLLVIRSYWWPEWPLRSSPSGET